MWSVYLFLNPLIAGFFTNFGLMREQIVTQRSMGRDRPTLLGIHDYKKDKFQGRDNSSLARVKNIYFIILISNN